MKKSSIYIIIIFIYLMNSSFSISKDVYTSLKIIDGDTIILNSEKIRFYGIDTPEKKQKCKDKSGLSYPCGLVATNELKKIIISGKLFCKKKLPIDTADQSQPVMSMV